MFTKKTQGKSHKVAATQEITTQNAEIQSYFNGMTKAEIKKVCEILSETYSSGLKVKPEYFENYLEMTNKFIHGARMGEDKRVMVFNAFQFLCGAIIMQAPVEYEHIANFYYPQDLFGSANQVDEEFEAGEIDEEERDERIEELILGCKDEIGTITGELWTLEGKNVDKDDLDIAFGELKEYLDFLKETGTPYHKEEAEMKEVAEAIGYKL